MLNTRNAFSELLKRDGRYHLDAYLFVFEALRFAHEELELGGIAPTVSLDEADDVDEDAHHLSGQQLCEAIRHYALEQYGLLAQSVLNHWGVKKTDDFGEIVFNLIEIGEMRKTKHDCKEDFEQVYDFDKGLRQSFQITPPRPTKRPMN